MTHRQQSYLVAAGGIAISLFFFVSSSSIKVDGDYPKVLCAALFFLAVLDIFETVLSARKEAKLPHLDLTEDQMTTEELAIQMTKETEENVPWQDVLAIIVIAFVSLILWKPISFIFAGALAIFAISLYKKQPTVKSLLVAVCTVVVLQLIFRNIFTIPLPSPSWWPIF